MSLTYCSENFPFQGYVYIGRENWEKVTSSNAIWVFCLSTGCVIGQRSACVGTNVCTTTEHHCSRVQNLAHLVRLSRASLDNRVKHTSEVKGWFYRGSRTPVKLFRLCVCVRLEAHGICKLSRWITSWIKISTSRSIFPSSVKKKIGASGRNQEPQRRLRFPRNGPTQAIWQ